MDSFPDPQASGTAAVMVTLTEADLLGSAWLVTVMSYVAGEGIAEGASKVTFKPAPIIVPNVVLPLATVFTLQLTAVFAVPATVAVSARLPCAGTFAERPDEVVSVIPTPGVIVTLTEADFELSAVLVAVTLNVAGVGTVGGAV